MSVSSARTPDPRTLQDAVVFRVGDLPVTRAEVRRWAERFDAAYAARVARRAALAALDLDDDPSLDAEVEADASEFRYARELESAETLMEWLAMRGLTVDAWWESIRRSALERRFAGQTLTDQGIVTGEEPADDVGAESADLVVTDLLHHAAEALARRLVVAQAVPRGNARRVSRGASSLDRGVPGSAPSGFDARHDELEAVWIPWRAALMTDEALQQAVNRERLSWIVLDFVRSDWSSADAAREAVSCVLVDGSDLREVARDAGGRAEEQSCLLADVPDVLHDALLTAASGDVVGPIALPPRWIVLRLQDKRAPSLLEPLVREAAEGDVERRAVAPLMTTQVVWSEPRP